MFLLCVCCSAGEAILRCGLPGNDYFMVFGILVEMALIVLLGFALSWYMSVGETHHGYCI
jgi:hypothetical protein